jgi:hypothetical protein
MKPVNKLLYELRFNVFAIHLQLILDVNKIIDLQKNFKAVNSV